MQTNPFKEFGKRAAAAMLDMSQDELSRLDGYASVMGSHEAEAFDREVCKIAAAAFECTGGAGGFHAQLFNCLATTPEWSPGYAPIVDSVKRACALQPKVELADERLIKSALVPEVLAAIQSRLSGNVLGGMVSAGAIGGAGLGSLAFLLSRNARQASADNSETLEKVKAYNQLRRDIEEDMRNNDVLSEAAGKKDKSSQTYNV